MRQRVAALAVFVVVMTGATATWLPTSPSSSSRRSSTSGCTRPYSRSSPWNRPIGTAPAVQPNSDAHVRSIEGVLSSDPSQYTYPVYAVDAGAPRVEVLISGTFSDVTDGGEIVRNLSDTTVAVPLRTDMEPSAGSDRSIVVVDKTTGDEWGFWRLERTGDQWRARNGYHYNTTWSGVPPRDSTGRPFVSRGAGLPYLAGLVRRCEIDRGRIEHALAFAYDFPSSAHVYPATKSDGKGKAHGAMPEGTRLQLDPALSEAELAAAGCTGPCLTLARAMQKYGMYVVDNSGRPKVIVEYEGTANWNGVVTSETVQGIPASSLRVVGQPLG